MVKITNGSRILMVSNSAYKTVFKQQGYKVVGRKEAVEVVNTTQIEQNVPEDDNMEPEDNAEVDEEEQSEDDKKIIALLEKPLGSWNKKELSYFTKVNEIDTTSAKSVADVKELVKEFLK